MFCFSFPFFISDLFLCFVVMFRSSSFSGDSGSLFIFLSIGLRFLFSESLILGCSLLFLLSTLHDVLFLFSYLHFWFISFFSSDVSIFFLFWWFRVPVLFLMYWCSVFVLWIVRFLILLSFDIIFLTCLPSLLSFFQYPFPSGRRQLRKWFDKVKAVMLGDPQHVTQAFELATFRMRGLLREDQPESSWNSAADDEFQTLECLSGVIYEPDMDVSSLRSESCGSTTGFCLEDLLRRLDEE